MATKKTDRPIGRAKKPIMPFSVRRARGRPELDFMTTIVILAPSCGPRMPPIESA
jgi:hypothetical protein